MLHFMTYAIIYEYSEIISEIMCTKVPDAEISIMCVCVDRCGHKKPLPNLAALSFYIISILLPLHWHTPEQTSTLARAQAQTHNPVESAAALELVTSGTLAVIATPARKRDSDLATTAAAAAAAAAAAFAAVVKETAVATIDSEAMALPVGAAAKQAAKPAAARLRASKRHAWTQRQPRASCTAGVASKPTAWRCCDSRRSC